MPAAAEDANVEPPPALPDLSPPADFTESEVERLVKLYETDLLFKKAGYEQVRSVFADRFARRNATAIAEVCGPVETGFRKWLEAHPTIRDELYTAVDERYDRVEEVLRIFRVLAEKYPEGIESHASLAIAAAVVWDSPQHVYSYEGLARQVRSPMPQGQTGMLENFEYFLETEPVMQGRPQWLPWEFLIHVVNHTTPLEERHWALARYLPRREMFGKCYHDVEYDYVALDTDYAQARLEGQLYTLPNLDAYGGVCVYQADFASRVGKSLGVPAVEVRGTSQFDRSHAWVMWVEVKSVGAQGIAFTLESHGRYRFDHYYVGTLRDPQTGELITDRKLELRLHAAGRDPRAKRQSELAVAAMPAIVDYLELDPARQFAYVARVIDLCPVSEQAWIAASQLVSHPEVQARLQKKARETLEASFQVFARFPDFTWEIMDDLVAARTRPKDRIAVYERLVAHYQQVERPDLACEALLRLCDLYQGIGAEENVVALLAQAILAIPHEGRYVPRLLERLEEICASSEGTTPRLLDLYARLLPRIPQKRGDRTSDYCLKMYQRGAQLFRQHGMDALAHQFEREAVKLKQGAL